MENIENNRLNKFKKYRHIRKEVKMHKKMQLEKIIQSFGWVMPPDKGL